MSYSERFRNRVLAKGKTNKEIQEFEGRRNFKLMLENKLVPTVHEVVMSINDVNEFDAEEINIMCEIGDVANNDQKTFDEKYISFEVGEDIRYGNYVDWDNHKWIIIYDEKSSYEISQVFVMRMCNGEFKFKHNGVVYSIPHSVKNSSPYSHGIDEKILISRPRSQRQIIMANNTLTKNIKIDTRFILTPETVYEVTDVDEETYPGLRIMIAKETSFNDLDDKDNLVAYNDEDEVIVNTRIIGVKEVHLGDTVKYTTEDDNHIFKVSDDKVVIVDNKVGFIQLKIIGKLANANKSFKVELFDENDMLVDYIEVMIRGVF